MSDQPTESVQEYKTDESIQKLDKIITMEEDEKIIYEE